jgi:hypothetical protein
MKKQLTEKFIETGLGQSFSHPVNNGRLPFIQKGWNAVRHNEYRYTPEE